MDELVMTISATARETRILLTQGPDEVMKARLRAVATPAHRFAGPMLLLPISPQRGELTSRRDHERPREPATSRRDHERPREPATSRREHRGPRRPTTSHRRGRRDHSHSRSSLTSPTDHRAIVTDRAPR